MDSFGISFDINDKSSNTEDKVILFENCLRKTIPNAKVLTDGEEFESSNYQWNLRNPIAPIGIFVPAEKIQIQAAMECSIQTNAPIVAKCGGHSYEKHSFGTGKEIIIDLNRLNMIAVDSEAQTATIQAGALLGQVYYQLFKQGGYALPGGSCPGVGIAGHTLGGGYGLSARKHGFMLDNLLQIDIVLPNGQAVIASKESHSDLFWALRGAGAGNFGIVSEFKFKLFKPPNIVTRIQYLYKFDHSEEAFKAFQKWTASDPDPAITTIANFGKGGFNINSVILPDSENQLTSILNQLDKVFPKSFYNNQTRYDTDFIGMIKDLSDIKLNNVEELKTINHGIQPKKYFKAKSIYIDREFTVDEILEWKKTVEDLPNEYLALLDMQGGALNSFSRSETAFVHRQKPIYSMQLIVEYPPEDFEKISYYGLEVYFNRLGHLFSSEAYQNYIDNEDGIGKYYGENLNELIRIKSEYDPNNRFFNIMQILPN